MKTTLKQLLLDMILAVLIFTQIAGCAVRAGWDKYPHRSRVFAPASGQIVTNARIPSLKEWEQYSFSSVKGTVEWSNGHEDYFFFEFNKIDKQYAVLAVELNPGQEVKDVTFKVTALGNELVLSPHTEYSTRPDPWLAEGLAPGLLVLGIFLSPLILLGMLIRIGTETLKSTRAPDSPFDGCCFVWLADVETGETISGESPEGVKVIFSESIRSATPAIVPTPEN